MKKINFKILLGLLFLGVSVLFLLYPGEKNVVISQIFYLIAPITAVLAGVYTMGFFGCEGRKAVILKLIFAGVTLWLFGEVTTLYFMWEDLDFYPTISDLAFISGYGLFTIAVILKIKLFGLDFKKIGYKVLTFFSIAFLLILIVVGYSAFLGYDQESSFLANFTTFSWSLGDLASGGLAILLLMMVWEYQGGAVRIGWLWFIGAIGLNLIADTVYSLNPDIILEGSWVAILLNIIWIAGYFMFAGYFFEQKTELDRLKNKI